MFRTIHTVLWSAVAAAGITTTPTSASPSEEFRQVGLAAVDITPEHPIRLIGYAARKTESEGITQRLWAKAMAIGSDETGPAVLITVETCVLPDAIAQQVADRLKASHGILRERLAISVSHTHTGPALPGALPTIFGEPMPPEHQANIDRYAAYFVDRLVEVATAALADRRPARLGLSYGKATFAANRRAMRDGRYAGFGINPDGPVDHSMPMLRVTDAVGKLRAVIVNYACHCTTLGSDFNEICGDWAGYAQEYVEADHPGALCLITIGCGADANPEPRLKLEHAMQHGRTIAGEVKRLLAAGDRPIAGALACRFDRIQLPLAQPPTREQLEERARSETLQAYNAKVQLERLDSGQELARHVPYALQTWVFGDDLAMIFLAGEVVVDYALRFKAEFDPNRLWITAYTNDVPCYIPSRRILAEGGYEADQSMILYGWPTRFAPEVEELIAAGVGAMLPAGFRSPAPAARHPQPEEADRIRKAAAAAYEQLLARYPEDSQGLGSDSHFPTAEHQPMTYGLVLSSEALRFGRTGSDESRRRARKAMQWLLDNSDLDGDGKPGWGLPQAWDAFQDGTVNPENHPYTITTALVLNGMLDALAQPSLVSESERERIRELAAQVVLRWCREAWSEGYGGGYFWYSPTPDDDIFAVNSPSMFLGSIMRLLRDQPEALSAEERRLVLDRADGQARSIVAAVEMRDGMPFWNYMPLPNFRDRSQPNDLVHHVYTLWGIETYRECGGQVPLPWTPADVHRSLETFWADGRIHHFPQDTEYPQEQAALKERPAVLWSAGALLVAYARWGSPEEAANALAVIDRDYGPLPDLRLRPSPAPSQPAFYPRQASHVLWGLALHAAGTEPLTRVRGRTQERNPSRK